MAKVAFYFLVYNVFFVSQNIGTIVAYLLHVRSGVQNSSEKKENTKNSKKPARIKRT